MPSEENPTDIDFCTEWDCTRQCCIDNQGTDCHNNPEHENCIFSGEFKMMKEEIPTPKELLDESQGKV